MQFSQSFQFSKWKDLRAPLHKPVFADESNTKQTSLPFQLRGKIILCKLSTSKKIKVVLD